ncbi:MAG: Fur family transcriptional regulator [Nitriliruptorales bacterium]
MARDAEVAETLREHGYRLTRPRQAVWRVLLEAEGHLTAEQVAAAVEERSPGVNLASIYRSLALLADLDLVRETRVGEGDAARWEVAHPDEHFHLVCENCGEVTHHAGDLVDQVRGHLAAEHGFEARSVELIVTGCCARCAR